MLWILQPRYREWSLPMARRGRGKAEQAQPKLVPIVLGVFDLLRRPITALGIEYSRFRALLELKLLLDTRRGGVAKERGEQTPFSAGLMMTCLVNLILGGLSGIGIVVFRDWPGIGMALSHLLLMCVTTMILLVDYSAVLLDTTELDIVAPMPVSDATVYAARVAHVLVYLSLVVGSLCFLPLMAGCLVHSSMPFAPIFLISSALITLWCVGLAFGAFLLAMRLFDLERLKNVLLFVQIGATVAVFGAYQLFPRLLRGVEVVEVLDRHAWASYVLPPLHQAALYDVVTGTITARTVTLAVLAVVLPLVLVVLTVQLARGGFVSGLASMTQGERSSVAPRRRRPLLRGMFARTQVARAGYDFFTVMARRERQFRLRTYPMVAFALVFGFVIAFQGRDEGVTALMCGAIYALGINVSGVVLQARFSDDHEAGWLLKSTPFDRPGDFIAGAMFSLITTFLLPSFVIVMALLLAIAGWEILPDAIFSIEAVLVLGLLAILTFGRQVPFTQKPVKNPAQGSVGMMIFFSFLAGIAILAHFLLRMNPFVFVGSMLALAVLIVYLIGVVRRLRPEGTGPARG